MGESAPMSTPDSTRRLFPHTRSPPRCDVSALLAPIWPTIPRIAATLTRQDTLPPAYPLPYNPAPYSNPPAAHPHLEVTNVHRSNSILAPPNRAPSGRALGILSVQTVIYCLLCVMLVFSYHAAHHLPLLARRTPGARLRPDTALGQHAASPTSASTPHAHSTSHPSVHHLPILRV
ncbi:hypothetical protein FS749_005745 [Ceratobasidium sp. UAMH 11750]|nr:hypothetical protein FS749_005745 [Ceratobasidium sp. UAMH 11750]